MANIKSAKKRVRQAIKHREHNVSMQSAMRTSVKKVRTAIVSKNKTAALEAFKTAVSALDSSRSKKLVHKNKAARIKSRLNAQIKQLA